MIKVENNSCEIRGTGMELLAELSMIINELYEIGFPDELIESAVKVGKLYAEKKLDFN